MDGSRCRKRSALGGVKGRVGNLEFKGASYAENAAVDISAMATPIGEPMASP